MWKTKRQKGLNIFELGSPATPYLQVMWPKFGPKISLKRP